MFDVENSIRTLYGVHPGLHRKLRVPCTSWRIVRIKKDRAAQLRLKGSSVHRKLLEALMQCIPSKTEGEAFDQPEPTAIDVS